MKKFTLILAATSLVAINTSAFAINAQEGFYLGANGGQGYIMAPTLALTNNWLNNVENYETTNNVWGAQAGYNWVINPNATYGVELQYTQNGHASYSGSGLLNDTGSLSYNSSSVNILGTLSYICNNGINVFGKLGAAVVTQTANVTGPVYINGIQESSSRSSTTQVLPKIEFGVGFMPSQHVNIYLEEAAIYGDMRPSDWIFSNKGFNSNVYTTTSIRFGVNFLF